MPSKFAVFSAARRLFSRDATIESGRGRHDLYELPSWCFRRAGSRGVDTWRDVRPLIDDDTEE